MQFQLASVALAFLLSSSVEYVECYSFTLRSPLRFGFGVGLKESRLIIHGVVVINRTTNNRETSIAMTEETPNAKFSVSSLFGNSPKKEKKKEKESSTEYGVAKMFQAGTMEDAAFVAENSLEEFRRLASSSSIPDQRRLLNLAATVEEAGERAIPPHLASGNVRGEEFIIRRGKTSSALETVKIAFNGHGGFGGKRNPKFDWSLALIGPPDDPRRIAVTHSHFAPILSCAEAYGTILEVRVGNITVASCACFYPGGLEKNRSIFMDGSDRYNYSMNKSGATPTMNGETMGRRTLQRVSLKHNPRQDEHRKNYGPMFYIAVLGVHPSYQGRGYGKKLLNVVANWADNEGMDCYLECAEANVPIYNRCGYKVIWREDVKVEENVVTTFGMARNIKWR